MDVDDDDEDNGLLTVSRNCRPVLEHKLVSGILTSTADFYINFIVTWNSGCCSW